MMFTVVERVCTCVSLCLLDTVESQYSKTVWVQNYSPFGGHILFMGLGLVGESCTHLVTSHHCPKSSNLGNWKSGIPMVQGTFCRFDL